MENAVQLSDKKVKKNNILIIALSVFIMLMLSATTTFIFMTLRNDKVYSGIYIGSQNAFGMTVKDLELLLDKKYQSPLEDLEILLKTDKSELQLSYPELNVQYDIQAAAKSAYDIGHSGNIFVRLYDIAHACIKGVTIDMPMTFDEDRLDRFINQFYTMTFMNVRESTFFISDSNASLRSGSHGENIDKEKTKELVKKWIEDKKSGVIEPEIIVTLPVKFDVNELYQQIVREPVDAGYTFENSIMTLSPHTVGRQIDKIELANIADELYKSENTERILPVTYISPAITSESAASMLFRDELASFATFFSIATQNGKNRGHNISISADKINDMILAPGQEFSFNDVVGPRDLAHGFKIAHVYSAGKIIDGVGGGICQVSSTMYNSVLEADLQVTERRNHSFTVGYVPLGQDATAYYGGTDFKFVNSSKWPIKLKAAVKGNKITFAIIGTNESPGKTVMISNKILKETPFPVKYTDDPTLPIGTTKEKQEGMTGYVVETYKTIKTNGKVISQTKLHTSTYRAYAQVILNGTKPVEIPTGTDVAKPENAGSTPATTTTPSPSSAAGSKPTEEPSAAEPQTPDGVGPSVDGDGSSVDDVKPSINEVEP